MKKHNLALLGIFLALIMIGGCRSGGNAPTESPAPQTATPMPTPTVQPSPGASATAAPTNGTVKTGLGIVNSIAKSTDAGEIEGLAQVDSVIVGITLGQDGKILDCKIDAAQTKINFTKDGKITTPLDTEFKTKQELGDEYGMKNASSIQKEWYEQADAFSEYVKGKTVEEVKGIAVNEEGVPTEADLTSSVTIHVGDFIKAIEKAAAGAMDMGAQASDKLGLGIMTTIDKSADAGDEEGVAQAYSNYTVCTYDDGGKITSCIIDASQTNVNFTKEGKITSNLSEEPKTKNELGSAYGLGEVSSIKKEWNEQAVALAQYVQGKTIDEVKGIAVNAEGVPTEPDLTGSVTIHIGDYIAIIEKSAANAK